MSKRIKILLVENCINWQKTYETRGNHCFNCIMRNGYPYRAQPDKNCKNFKILDKNKKIKQPSASTNPITVTEGVKE